MTAPQLPAVLHQDELWVDGQRVEDMDWKHRSNLIPFLRRGAKILQLTDMRYAESVWPPEEEMSDGVYGAYSADMAQYFMEPEDWLEATPLMRKLVEMEAGLSLSKRRWLAARNKAYEVVTGYKKVTL